MKVVFKPFLMILDGQPRLARVIGRGRTFLKVLISVIRRRRHLARRPVQLILMKFHSTAVSLRGFGSSHIVRVTVLQDLILVQSPQVPGLPKLSLFFLMVLSGWWWQIPVRPRFWLKFWRVTVLVLLMMILIVRQTSLSLIRRLLRNPLLIVRVISLQRFRCGGRLRRPRSSTSLSPQNPFWFRRSKCQWVMVTLTRLRRNRLQCGSQTQIKPSVLMTLLTFLFQFRWFGPSGSLVMTYVGTAPVTAYYRGRCVSSTDDRHEILYFRSSLHW